MQTIRTTCHIEAEAGWGYGIVINSDHAEQITDDYLEALVDWAMDVWDWGSVVTKDENRAEELEYSDGHIIYSLSRDDLIGLFGGKYGGSPGAIAGFMDGDSISDEWADIVAYCFIPAGRFSPEVIDELKEVA
jgi:hypothetical protein